MKLEQLRRTLATCFAGVLMVTAPLAVNAEDAPVTLDTEMPSWLFVQEAVSGTLKGRDDQHLKLTLNNVRDYTTAFSDRPYREAYKTSNERFLDEWRYYFAEDPPNAALTYVLPGRPRVQTIILELTNPRYNAARRTMTYDAARIHEAVEGGGEFTDNDVRIPRVEFESASLFIDDAICDLYCQEWHYIYVVNRGTGPGQWSDGYTCNGLEFPEKRPDRYGFAYVGYPYHGDPTTYASCPDDTEGFWKCEHGAWGENGWVALCANKNTYIRWGNIEVVPVDNDDTTGLAEVSYDVPRWHNIIDDSRPEPFTPHGGNDILNISKEGRNYTTPLKGLPCWPGNCRWDLPAN